MSIYRPDPKTLYAALLIDGWWVMDLGHGMALISLRSTPTRLSPLKLKLTCRGATRIRAQGHRPMSDAGIVEGEKTAQSEKTKADIDNAYVKKCREMGIDPLEMVSIERDTTIETYREMRRHGAHKDALRGALISALGAHRRWLRFQNKR